MQYSNPYDETVSVTIRDVEGGIEQTIVSNRIHPYFVQTERKASNSEGHAYHGSIPNGKWIDAADLQSGDRLLNDDASWAEVVSVKVEAKPLKAYNLTVADFHTYFVAADKNAVPVWVHNDCFDTNKILSELGVDIKTFHKDIKKSIKADFNVELKKTGIKNPDIGFDKNGNIIFRDPVSKKIVLRTDVNIKNYGD